jgi:hypothetical protein
MEEERKAYKVLVGKPEGNRGFGRRRRRWENVIRMDFGEIGWGCVEWIQLAQDRDRWRALINAALKIMGVRVVPPRG